MNKKQELRVIRNYSFWKHPIRWIKDIKTIRIANVIFNNEWNNGLKEEVEKMTKDMIINGTALMKDGKRINYKQPKDRDFYQN